MSKNKLIKELSLPVLLLILSVVVVIVSLGYGKEGEFPILIAIGMFISTLYLCVKIVMEKKETVFFDMKNRTRVLLTLATLIVYVLVMSKIGYVLSTILLGHALFFILGFRQRLLASVITISTVLIVFVLFKVLLKVSLPTLFIDF